MKIVVNTIEMSGRSLDGMTFADLCEKVKTVNEDFNLVEIEFCEYYDGDPSTIEFLYRREETPSEAQARERKETERVARDYQERYERERREFERLKAKFEPK